MLYILEKLSDENTLKNVTQFVFLLVNTGVRKLVRYFTITAVVFFCKGAKEKMGEKRKKKS